jgi:hypothetical protein
VGSSARTSAGLARLGSCLAIGAAVAAGPVAGASAGTVTLDDNVLRFRPYPGVSEQPAITLRPLDSPTEIVVKEPHADPRYIAPGPGCAYAGPRSVRCPLVAGRALPGVRIALGDQDESSFEGATVESRLRAVVYGGPGNDYINARGELYGGEGADAVSAQGAGSKLFGGLGDDEMRGGPGADFINPGPGRDDVWLVNERRGRTAWKDTRRDTVWSRDGELDDIYCDSRGPADVLRVDRFDWPSDWAKESWPLDRTRPCEGVFRSAPPLPLPAGIDSPDYEVSDGTQVWVFCPTDGKAVCEGTIMLRVLGDTFGPVRFRVRAGNMRPFHMTSHEYGWDESDSVATFITLRVRDRGGRLVRIRATMFVGPSPYDSS